MLTIETQKFLEGLKNLNLPPIEQVPVEILRDQYETMVTLYGGRQIDHIKSHDSSLQLQNISKPINIRTFDIEDPDGIIIFAHGGGWTRGSLNTHHVMCQNLAQATHKNVISVDYSLSPESPYPTAINEIEAVYKYVQSRSEIPISLSGDSAGANLMAGLVVRLNHKVCPLPEECIFFYPSLDLTGKSGSLKEFSDGYILSKHSVEYYVKSYLGGDLSLACKPEVSPLWEVENINFPKTLIVAAEIDPIRDDSRVLKGILEKKGALKGYLEVPGVIHVFAQFPGLFPEASQTFEWISTFYKN